MVNKKNLAAIITAGALMAGCATSQGSLEMNNGKLTSVDIGTNYELVVKKDGKFNSLDEIFDGFDSKNIINSMDEKQIPEYFVSTNKELFGYANKIGLKVNKSFFGDSIKINDENVISMLANNVGGSLYVHDKVKGKYLELNSDVDVDLSQNFRGAVYEYLDNLKSSNSNYKVGEFVLSQIKQAEENGDSSSSSSSSGGSSAGSSGGGQI